MLIDAELAHEIERGVTIRRQARVLKAESAWLRSHRECLPHRTEFLLLAIAEHLIDAHVTAKQEGDGATIDIIQDAMMHVGRRLAKESKSDGRSARTILGHFGQEADGGPDRDGSVSEP